ncbi:protein kinase [Terrabacter sp. NPDC000476]|uniref:protein kinase domain-containing protein n=1 Tax=Terrabacter sp. NPDC000476 TaxID=3154258 RepID=UPI0033226360
MPGHVVEGVVGIGSSAVVWSGRDAAGRPVALKVSRRAPDPGTGGAGDPTPSCSAAEQHVLMAVRHDHLVPLRSVVPLADGRVALVFDLVRGVQLHALVRARGHLRPGEVVTVVTPVCEAVAAVHAAGGLHADLSPGNVLVTPDGRPVLLDLGSARLAGQPEGEVVGTPGFVAPELRLGGEPSEASDVYALGALAWFCVTGNGAPDTLQRLDPQTVASHVGPELGPLVAACLDPDPDLRPSAAELARWCWEDVPAEPVEVVLGDDGAAALTHRLRAQARADPPSPRRVARRRRRWLAPLVAALVLAGLAWAAVAREPGGSAVAPTPGVASSVTATPGLVSVGSSVGSSGGRSAAPPARGSPVPRASPSPVASPVASPVGSPEALLRAVSAPARSPEDLLQVLSDRRATALASRDPAGLAAVDATGSPSEAADRALVSELVRSGLRWQRLRLQVAEATYVGGSSTRAVLRARVDWTAYVVLGSDGSVTTRPADAGERLDFTVVRGAQGWRLRSVSAPPAT